MNLFRRSPLQTHRVSGDGRGWVDTVAVPLFAANASIYVAIVGHPNCIIRMKDLLCEVPKRTENRNKCQLKKISCSMRLQFASNAVCNSRNIFISHKTYAKNIYIIKLKLYATNISSFRRLNNR